MKKSGAVSKRVLKADVSERPLKCAKSDEQENSSPSNGPAREARENSVPAVMMRTSGASGSSSDRTKKKMVIKPYSVRRRSNKLLSMRPSRARSIIYWKARRRLLLAYSRLVLTLRTQIKPKIPESFEDDAWEKLKAAVDAVCCRAAVHRSRELAHPQSANNVWLAHTTTWLRCTMSNQWATRLRTFTERSPLNKPGSTATLFSRTRSDCDWQP